MPVKQPSVVHLCDFSPEYAGTFIDSMLWLAEYCRHSLKLEMICIFPETAKERDWLKRFDEQGFQYAFIPRRRNVVTNLRELIHRGGWEPLIFHTHFSTFDLAPVLLKFGSSRALKIIWHYHNPPGATFLQRIKDTIKLRLLARNSSVFCIAVGEGVHEKLVAAGIRRQDLALVHNGISAERFVSRCDLRRRAREFLNISEKETVVLLLGWEPFRKGVDVFLRAAAIARGGADKLFLIVGRKETREFAAKLPEFARLGARARIIDPTDDFPLLLNGIDLMVSASRSEAFSYAVSEAMAAGKLVLSSDVPGMREIYRAAAGVWFFPSADAKKLAELIDDFDRLTPVERDHLGSSNREYVIKHYSLRKWSEKIGGIYQMLVSVDTPALPGARL